MSKRPPAVLRGLMLGLAMALPACQSPQGPGPAPTVTMNAEFRAMWWSQEQMKDLNPESPPARETEVVLTKWEYTDPVGVPNPEKVDLVVTIANSSNQALTDLEVRGVTRWKEGRLADEAGAEWRPGDTLTALGPVRVDPRGTATARFRDLDLKRKQDVLFGQDRWPWVLEVRVSLVSAAHPGKVFAETVATLPIHPGD